jgi:hypothetical protein
MADNGENVSDKTWESQAELVKDQVRAAWNTNKYDNISFLDEAAHDLYQKCLNVNDLSQRIIVEAAKKERSVAFEDFKKKFNDFKLTHSGIVQDVPAMNNFFKDAAEVQVAVSAPAAPSLAAPVSMARPVPPLDPHEAKLKDVDEKRKKLETSEDAFKAAVLAVQEAERLFKEANTALQGVLEGDPGREAVEQRENQTKKEYESALEDYRAAKKDRTEAFKDSQEAYNNVNADPRTSFNALIAQAAIVEGEERVKTAGIKLASVQDRLNKAELALKAAKESGSDTSGLQREVNLATALKDQAEANVRMKEADLEVSKLKEHGYPVPDQFKTQFKLATAEDHFAWSKHSLAQANVNLIQVQNALAAETVDTNKSELTAQVEKRTAEKKSSEAYSEFRTASMEVLRAKNADDILLASMNEEIAQAKFVAANIGIEVLILEQKVSKIPVNGPSKNVAKKMLEAARERETTAKAIVENLEAVKAASNDPNDISALLDKEAKLITEKEKHAASEEAFFKAGQQVAKQELDAREIEYVQQQFDDEGRRLESREQRLKELQSELDEAEDVDKPGLDRDIKSLTKDIDIDKAKIEISQTRLKVLEAKMNSDFNYNADEKPALEKIVKKAEGKLKEAEANEKVVRAEVEVTYLTERLEEVQREFDVADEKSKPGLAVQIKECKAFKEIYIAKAKLADAELEVAKANNAVELDSANLGLVRKRDLASFHVEIARADITVAEKEFEVVRKQNIVDALLPTALQNDKDVANGDFKSAILAKTVAKGTVKTLVQEAAITEAMHNVQDIQERQQKANEKVTKKTGKVTRAEQVLKAAPDAASKIAAQTSLNEARAKLESVTALKQSVDGELTKAQAHSDRILEAVSNAREAVAPVTAAQDRVNDLQPKHAAAKKAVRYAQEKVAAIEEQIGDEEPDEDQAENLAAANAELATAQAEAKTTAAKLAEAETDLKAAQANLKAADKEVDEIIKPADKKAEDNKAALTMREFIKAVERSDDLRARAGAQWSRLQKSDFGKALGEAGDRLNKNVKGFSGHHMGEAELLEAALFNMLLLLFEILFGAGKVAKAGIKEVYKQVNRNHLSSQDLRKLSVKDHKSALEEAKKYKYDPANKDKLDAALLKMAQAEATHEKHGSKASEAEYNKLKKDYDGVNKSLIDARKKYVAAKTEHELMSFSDRFKDPTKGQEVNRLEEQVRELEVSELNAYLKIKELDTKTDKISPELEAMKADREAAGFDDTVMNAPREKYKDVQRYGELQENITELNAEKERLGTKAVDLKLELEDCEKNGSKYGANQEAIEAQKTKIQKSIKTNADKMAANATGMRDAMVEMNDLAGRIEADPAQKQMVKAEKTRTEKLFGKRAVESMVKNLVDLPIPIVSNAAGVALIAVPVSDPLSKPVISVQAGDNPDEEKPNIWSKIVGKIRSLGRSKPDEASMQLMSLEMGDEESPEEDEEAQHKHDAPTAVAGPNPASPAVPFAIPVAPPIAPSVSSSVDAVPVPPLEDNRNDRELFSVTHSEPALNLAAEAERAKASGREFIDPSEVVFFGVQPAPAAQEKQQDPPPAGIVTLSVDKDSGLDLDRPVDDDDKPFQLQRDQELPRRTLAQVVPTLASEPTLTPTTGLTPAAALVNKPIVASQTTPSPSPSPKAALPAQASNQNQQLKPPKPPHFDLNQVLEEIKEHKKKGPTESANLIPRFKKLYEFGLQHQAQLDLTNQVKTLPAGMPADDLVSATIMFAYKASMPPKDGEQTISEQDNILLQEITKELNDKPEFREQLKALREKQDKTAAADPNASGLLAKRPAAVMLSESSAAVQGPPPSSTPPPAAPRKKGMG